MPYPNIKDVILRWLEYRYTSLNLTSPIVLLGDFPSQTMLSQLPVGEDGQIATNNLRGVSVVLLDGSVKRKGVGDVVTSQMVERDEQGNEIVKYGWHENLDVEISYWSVSSRDRDFGGDLLRAFIFEAFRIGHFLENGIVEMYLKSYYDTSDSRLKSLNRVLSYSVSTFSFTRVFFGTLDYSQLNEERPLISSISQTLNMDASQQELAEYLRRNAGLTAQELSPTTTLQGQPTLIEHRPDSDYIGCIISPNIGVKYMYSSDIHTGEISSSICVE